MPDSIVSAFLPIVIYGKRRVVSSWSSFPFVGSVIARAVLHVKRERGEEPVGPVILPLSIQQSSDESGPTADVAANI